MSDTINHFNLVQYIITLNKMTDYRTDFLQLATQFLPLQRCDSNIHKKISIREISKIFSKTGKTLAPSAYLNTSKFTHYTQTETRTQRDTYTCGHKERTDKHTHMHNYIT